MSVPDGQPHYPTCTCGRRAPVQGDDGRHARGEGTITWAEHLDAYAVYSGMYGSNQSATLIAKCGGFSYGELVDFLGHAPTTWEAR